jgi:hypothetical protein
MIPVRVTCDPLIERVVIVFGEGEAQYSVGLSDADAAVMIEQIVTACALIAEERLRRTRPQ